MIQLLFKSEIRLEDDIVWVRRKTWELAKYLGMDTLEQTRLATAISEVARNAYQYASGGMIVFSIDQNPDGVWLKVEVNDNGKGIKNLREILNGTYVSPEGMGVGLAGSIKLVDKFLIDSTPHGTKITISQKLLRPYALDTKELNALTDGLMAKSTRNPIEEIQKQNHEILLTIKELNQKKEELLRLNKELEDTNRGVVALYAELDEKAESLKIANETKTSFLSDMTHEFRSPLNSILSISEILLADAKDEKATDREKQIGFIMKAAKGLSTLVNDLLDIAKIEAGKIPVRTERFTVRDLFSTLRGLMRPLENNPESVQLIFDDAFGSVELTTDEGKLTQILRNLISNALKYTEVGTVTVSAKQEENEVIFSVTDTGIGMGQADLMRIFSEFYQADNKLQKINKGTGLGLSLTKKLVSLLDGTISVDSTEGVGSHFSIRIPLEYAGPVEGQYKEMPAPSLVAKTIASTSEVHKKILIVDDDEANRYAISTALKNYPIDIKEAGDGVEACQVLKTFRPDLIVLDLVMPRMNGIEFLRETMGQVYVRNIPILLYTSKDLDKEEREYLSQFTRSIVTKNDHSTAKVIETINFILG